jgi:tRNA-binding EMAP/Myf-like protein
MAGLEVEEMQPVAAPFSKVVVAKMLSAEKHPDADRLQVARLMLAWLNRYRLYAVQPTHVPV